MTAATVTRVFEFDAGHRYRYEVTVAADRRARSGSSAGMDFGDLKRLFRSYFEELDHALILWTGDPVLATVRTSHPDLRVVETTEPPTAEVLVEHAAAELARLLVGLEVEGSPVRLSRIRLYEATGPERDEAVLVETVLEALRCYGSPAPAVEEPAG